MQQSMMVAGVAAVGISSSVWLVSTPPAGARGFATLDSAYDRYTPRIIAGGQFYAKDLRELIAKNDWAGIKRALQEPPKRSKEDTKKQDGGIQERAAQAGGFSDARVLVACDLYASAFSDNSISEKTRAMKEQVEILRDVIHEMETAAKQALGEDTGGGLFGFGGKKVSKEQLAKTVRELYIKGGNAWNKYVFAANEELPLQFKKLPYL